MEELNGYHYLPRDEFAINVHNFNHELNVFLLERRYEFNLEQVMYVFMQNCIIYGMKLGFEKEEFYDWFDTLYDHIEDELGDFNVQDESNS